MAAYSDLLTELTDMVEAVTGLTRHKGPIDGSSVPSQALDGAFVARFAGGGDTGEQRGARHAYDEHSAVIWLWYALDHNDRLPTDKTALDHVLAIRDAMYARGVNLTGTSVTGWTYEMGTEAGGEILKVEINANLQHSTAVS